ncbi:BgTH12-00426 [Blumeria graminis f. sp. triticale]|uniref:RING-type E3 ubiquitin transferase n=4 Tax=Blumeria graminis TaxID=34373 RepID=A0A656KKM8_BLUGR|nr:hypothetical protein BGT96224_A21151 [Blumeria graminis f. sp. tritici 96224]CAD6504927.1 BgTH12-00426 [Blumeria graminis f. sp. triticale]VDB92947.1 BgtA-21151 [Blumeria graminis f. sp. tritici]
MSSSHQDKRKMTLNYHYPFAAAPDIIRSHQKDIYFEGVLLNHLSAVIRHLYGARLLHTYAHQARAFSSFLYLGLTTLIGNRTLGEEYCDIVQVEDDTLRLPAIGRRAGYIITNILLPYVIGKLLPKFRSRIQAKFESNLHHLTINEQTKGLSYKIQTYLQENMIAITSTSSVHAISLTIFYFTGAYYQLSKRIWGLRYIFTKRITPSEARVGYEVLGVLLFLQISVQTWIHIRNTLQKYAPSNAAEDTDEIRSNAPILDPLNPTQISPLLSNLSSHIQPSLNSVLKTHNIKKLAGPRYDLRNSEIMPWIKDQNRKCTLCLEELTDPSVVSCGHMFCWLCIADWIKEKPECPLCRREVEMQHVLPLQC